VQVEVAAATADQEPILANLIELYAHDFSEIADLRLDSSGRFGYAALPLYWQESNRYPFLVKVDGALGGFVLVKRGSEVSADESVWDVAEFFILRGYRRRGIGIRAAHEVWRKFPGPWEVRVSQRNQAARAFWSGAVAAFVGATVEASVREAGGKRWHVFSFDTEPARSN